MIVDSKEKVLQYIPQRDPIQMVDRLVALDGNLVKTQVTVTDGSIFDKGGKTVSFYGVLEHIAQSYALAHGYLYGSDIGMIGRITKLEAFFEPKAALLIETEITVINNMGNLVLISATAYQQQEKIISCEMYLHFNG